MRSRYAILSRAVSLKNNWDSILVLIYLFFKKNPFSWFLLTIDYKHTPFLNDLNQNGILNLLKIYIKLGMYCFFSLENA